MTRKSAATARTSRKPPAGKTDPHRKIGSDLAKIDASEPSPAEMEEIPELTDALMAGADLYHGPKLVRRGRPPQAGAPKRQVTLRLAPDLIDGFKAGGPGWQVRMEDALRAALNSGKGGSGSKAAPARTGPAANRLKASSRRP